MLFDDLLAHALGTDQEAEFDAITDAAAELTGCTLAAMTLVQGDTLWIKSSSQGPLPAIPLDQSFCAQLLATGSPLVVNDTRVDQRFATNPFVAGEPFLRFYAGVPLTVRQRVVGSLCVFDQRPRETGTGLLPRLTRLASVVAALVEARLMAAEERGTAARLGQALRHRDQLHRQFQQAERMAEIGSWRLCLADQSLEYSDQVYAIHDLPVGQPEALAHALNFYPLPDRDMIAAAVQRAIDTGQPYDLELDFVTAKGRLRRVRALGEPEIRDGAIVALMGVFQDITERHRLQQALERRANTDELTTLAGRRTFNAHLDELANKLTEQVGSVALILIDLDRFKEANDRFGHAAGDEVLCHVGRVLQAEWLDGSLAARLGGDEFALVVTSERLLHDLTGMVDRLRRALVVTVGGGDLEVTATLGVCRHEGAPTSRKALLEAADAALYRAKREGRGTSCFTVPKQALLIR